jgi:hypothetical protein
MPPMSTNATLTDRLDTMLTGWLEGHASTRGAGRADAIASAIITVRNDNVGQIELLCSRWGMRVKRADACAGTPWTVLTIEGRALPVHGLAKVARMLPRD